MTFRLSLAGSAIAAVCGLASAQSPAVPTASGSAAQKYLAANRTDLAITEYRKVVAASPANLEAQGNLGVLLFFRGDYADAENHLSAALRLQPHTARLEALRGMCEKRTGRLADAERDLESAFPRLTEPKIKLQAGLELIETFYASRQLDRAAAVAAVLREAQPADEQVLYLSYRIYSDLARASALGLATYAPGSARMKQVMAQELARQAKYPEAIAHYREAIAAAPHLPGAHFELGEMLNITGQSAAAEQEYSAALADNPADATTEDRLGELALTAGNPEAAGRHFSAALRLRPGDTEACLGIAKLQVAAGEPRKALELLERAISEDPLEAALRYQLGLVYRRLGRAEDAGREMKEFVRLREANARLRQTYRQMGLQPNPVLPGAGSDEGTLP